MSDPIIEAAVWRAYAKANPFLLGTDHTAALLAVLTAVTPLIRAEALEEAAQVAENYDGEFEEVHMAQGDIAAAIRALKPASPSPSADSA